jgi:hypothetical protein
VISKTIHLNNDTMISYTMEILEMVGWISLGFIPMYVALEVGSRQLTKRIPARQLLTVGGKE